MRQLFIGIVAIATSLAFAAGAGDTPPAAERTDEQPEAKEIGLLERSGRRLAQIDITVLGPPKIVSQLTREDFRLRIQLKKIPTFILDRYCPADDELPPVANSDTVATADASGPPADPGRPNSSYMFYMDQPLLTMPGRQNAISTTRQLIHELIRNGDQAMILSNANSLKVVEPMTSDPERLLAAIDRLEKDRTQWDTYADQENVRVNDVIETMNDDIDGVTSVERAMGRARRYQMEETWRTEKSMRRLSMSLTRLSDLSSPKAVIYFADTMRSNAGEHYLAYFGQRLRMTRLPLLGISADALMAQAPFDRIVNEASAQGIRFYPILSQGLVAPLDIAMTSALANSRAGTAPSQSNARFRQARDTLSNLGRETGGHAFVHGQSPSKVAERVRGDFSCLYIISFDPEGLSEDSALRVIVNSPREDIQIRTRGRIVIQSESARTTSRLIAAFAAPAGTDEVADPFAVRTTLIPTGYRDGRFTGLLQLSIPPGPLQQASWDLGASIIRDEKITAEPSGRISVPQPGVPVVFENEVTFKPGNYQIISVAHETSTGLVSSERIDVRWPDIKKHRAAISEIVILQPESGAFLRGERTRKRGPLARNAFEPIRTDRPVAIVGLVCRNRKQHGELSVKRRLIGESHVEFPPLVLSLGDEVCAQIRDLVPADSLGEGYYRYEVVVAEDGATLYEGSREFLAVSPETRANGG